MKYKSIDTDIRDDQAINYPIAPTNVENWPTNIAPADPEDANNCAAYPDLTWKNWYRTWSKQH